MAGLIKRGNKWVATFIAAGKEQRKATGIDVEPPGVTGKALTTAKREQEAKARIIADQLERAAKGEKVDAEKVKAIAGDRKGKQLLRGKHYMQGVAAFLNDWLKTRKPTSRAKDALSVRMFLEFLGDDQDMPLDMLTREHVRRFAEFHHERVSGGTVKNYLVYLKVAFKTAVYAGLIPLNPCDGITVPKAAEKQERRAFTREEVQTLIAILPGEWADMIRICIYTGGQRLGDVATMRWEQIDFDQGLLKMTTKKTSRRMEKPLIKPLLEVLERLEPGKKHSPYLFPIAARKFAQAHEQTNKLAVEFTGLLAKHGFIEPKQKQKKKKDDDRRRLSVLSFHSFRATAVTILRNSGLPADLVRWIIGHDSEDVERIYYRPDIQTVAEAMEHLKL